MNKLYLLKLAGISVFSKKARTFLTVLGVGVSVSIIVFLLGFSGGLQKIVDDQINQAEAGNVITVNSPRSFQLKIDQKALSNFKTISGVYSVEQMINISGKVTYHGSSVTLPIYGVTPKYFETSSLNFISGQKFIGGVKDKKTLVINRALMEKVLNTKNPDDVMNRVLDLDFILTNNLVSTLAENQKHFPDNKYEISGIIEKGDKPFIYIPADDLTKLGVDSVSQVKVFVSDKNKTDAVRLSIEQMGYQTSNVKDMINQINRISRLLKIFVIIMSLITLLVAIFSTLNTITIALVEQTKEIGFLRMIGIKSEDVMYLFFIESILLAMIGSILGVILALLFGWLVNIRVFYLIKMGYIPISGSLFDVPYLAIMIILVVSMCLGWVIGLAPARRAVKIEPLQALKY